MTFVELIVSEQAEAGLAVDLRTLYHTALVPTSQ